MRYFMYSFYTTQPSEFHLCSFWQYWGSLFFRFSVATGSATNVAIAITSALWFILYEKTLMSSVFSNKLFFVFVFLDYAWGVGMFAAAEALPLSPRTDCVRVFQTNYAWRLWRTNSTSHSLLEASGTSHLKTTENISHRIIVFFVQFFLSFLTSQMLGQPPVLQYCHLEAFTLKPVQELSGPCDRPAAPGVKVGVNCPAQCPSPASPTPCWTFSHSWSSISWVRGLDWSHTS